MFAPEHMSIAFFPCKTKQRSYWTLGNTCARFNRATS